MRDIASWYEKADAFAEGWFQVFRIHPPKGAVVLGLCVAEHETRCGDAWPGSHNWGAVTRRGLTVIEQGAIIRAGIMPVLNPQAAREASETAALQAMTTAGVQPGDDVTLHVDSLPTTSGNKPYFTWFAKEPDDVAGARYFIRVLAYQRPTCKTILEQGTDTIGLAAAMYRTKYYTGNHKDDPEANIRDYAKALAALFPVITVALTAWVPGADPPKPAPYLDPKGFDLGTTLGIQQALNYLTPAVTQLVEDGAMGPMTEAAIKRFQSTHGLKVDGIAGPKTQAAIRAML